MVIPRETAGSPRPCGSPSRMRASRRQVDYINATPRRHRSAMRWRSGYSPMFKSRADKLAVNATKSLVGHIGRRRITRRCERPHAHERTDPPDAQSG